MRFSSMLRRREWDFDQVPASLKHGGVGWERWRLFCIDEKREIIEVSSRSFMVWVVNCV